MKFPVSEYYQDHIIDGVTLTRGGGWWTAVLLIEDPKSSERIINLYTWQSHGASWKMRKSFTIRKAATLTKLQSALQEFSSRLS